MEFAESLSNGGTRVLVVDDDVGLVRSLSRALTHMGLDVSFANDGHSALRHLEQGQFDVLVLDLCMPGMDGLDLLRRAAADAAFPATILHSAYLDVPTTVAAMNAGACEVLQKPAGIARLVQRIQELTCDRAAATGGTAVRRRSATQDCGPEAKLLLGESAAMCKLRDSVRRVARFRNMAVLVEGPTGTGKELVAQSIHRLGCPESPLVSINCAAIPAELFESELFGHDAGAFTSARAARTGLLEEAGDGVLFLDEVGELPVALQAKLLRVLETREFRRVGSSRTRRFAARLVSATNRKLAAEASHAFRSDLYFRISGHTIRTPALVDRVDDIELLATHFVERFCAEHETPKVRLSAEALAALETYHWPGNVRQLKQVVDNAVMHAQGGLVGRREVVEALGGEPMRASADATGPVPIGTSAAPASPVEERPLRDVERDMILRAYQASGQNLSRAARVLGIPRTTLRDRLRRYGIR